MIVADAVDDRLRRHELSIHEHVEEPTEKQGSKLVVSHFHELTELLLLLPLLLPKDLLICLVLKSFGVLLSCENAFLLLL